MNALIENKEMVGSELCSARRGSGRRGSIFDDIGKMLHGRKSGRNSVDSNISTSSEPSKSTYRIVIMGSKQSGKTSIVSQFLYDTFPIMYRETVEEMYRGEFDIGGGELSLNIQDTGGCYVYEFPSMIKVSLYSADAVIIVFGLDDPDTFEEAGRLRDLVLQSKGPDTPIVVVGNKTDLNRQLPHEETEAVVLFDWENGYVECSAKENNNITAIFKELLHQTKCNFDIASSNARHPKLPNNPDIDMRRRQSVPMVPVFTRVCREGALPASPSPHSRRRSSLANFKKENCRVS